MRAIAVAISALLLATAAAHAYPPRYYNCGPVFLRIQTGAGSVHDANGNFTKRVFPTEWKIIENWKVTDPNTDDKDALAKAARAWGAPGEKLNLKCTDTGEGSYAPNSVRDKCRFNGKVCRKMSDEQWKQEFGDEDY
jgi:hypothetical protein